MTSILTQIADWANGAENETFDSEFFFEPSWLPKVLNGDRILIIGRKGTGKTAIARRAAEGDGTTVCAESVPFEAIDATRFGFHRDEAHEKEVLVRVCRYLILRTVCELFFENSSDATFTPALERALGFPLTDYRKKPLSERLRRIRVDVAGFGVDVGLHQASTSPSDVLDDRINRLTEFVEENIFSRTFRVIFDALDSGWIEACQDGHQARYARKIGALVAAAIDIRNHFKALGRRIVPLIFTRADIFSQIANAQRTAWEQDCGLHLEWTKQELQDLLLFRILKTARLYDSRCDQKRALEMAFKHQTGELVDFNGRQRRLRLIDYVIDFSIGRPRDVVVYLAKTAMIVARERGEGARITKEDVMGGLSAYGQFLREEIQDELGGEYPGIRRLLNGIRSTTASTLSFDQFGSIARRTVKEGMSEGELHLLAERLFELGVIGHQLADGSSQYVVRDRTAAFDELLPLRLHPSYSTALSVSV
ncbi:MAG: hypothetical protein AB7Q23_17315 [Hyphomonadaceae bacterium]